MKIAFTHNLQLTDSRRRGRVRHRRDHRRHRRRRSRAGGHEVEKIEVTGPASRLAARLEAFAPDLIFNTAEGRRGRAREAFYPALFEELGFPYTGSDAYVLTVTLDKGLTKLRAGASTASTRRAGAWSPRAICRAREAGLARRCRCRSIVKPNYEGSSKGIGDDSVARDCARSPRVLVEALRQALSGRRARRGVHRRRST